MDRFKCLSDRADGSTISADTNIFLDFPLLSILLVRQSKTDRA